MTIITPNFATDTMTAQSRQVADPITELLRQSARELIALALEAEVAEVMKQLRAGGADVVRNGYLPERAITTAIGDVSVEVPRIRSLDGEPASFASSMIPRYLRRSSSISAWAAYAYLKGISEGDIAKVLEVVLGEGAKKLTPSVLFDLKGHWTKEFHQWQRRDLSQTTFIYLYANGIHQKIRGDNPKICVLVLMGVDEDGKKHLIALEDGVRESTQSWREVLLGAKARGMNAANFATGCGAMGFWSALAEVFPSTAHQRCWMHKSGNVMNYLPMH
jgi:transposase-like protein